MLRVTIELLPLGSDRHSRQLAELAIVNDGSGDEETGHYDVRLSWFGHPESTWRRARVEDFPRQQLTAYDLLYRALAAVVGDRNRP